MAKLHLPPSKSRPDGENSVETSGVVVIVGANGSGKTRLGTWIELESPHNPVSHRVAAQKMLTMPDVAPTTTLSNAFSQFLYGQVNVGQHQRRDYRWSGNPATGTLNDFQLLLQLLFTEDYEVSTKYRQKQATLGRQELEAAPVTKLDKIKEIWEQIIPHRVLELSAGTIRTKIKGQSDGAYSASQMSDGERVIFYLIGQVLSAPEGGVIIIDEPEVHLHKSIQSELWNRIEAAKRNNLFVYLTHDLDFAASRVGATKVVLKDFDGKSWDWQEVPQVEDFPEDVLLKILGSRKPILFVEGEKGGLDEILYSTIYPDFAVIPCGGSARVIHATTSFASFKNMHRLDCWGIVDKDYHSASEIEHLSDLNIFVLPTSEIENLVLFEDVLTIMAHDLHIQDVDTVIERVKEFTFTQLERTKERLAAALAAYRIENMFIHFNNKPADQASLAESLSQLFASINPSDIYENAITEIEKIHSQQDYNAAIAIYNNKGLVDQISRFFALGPHGFEEHLTRLSKSESGQPIIDALRQHCPKFPQ